MRAWVVGVVVVLVVAALIVIVIVLPAGEPPAAPVDAGGGHARAGPSTADDPVPAEQYAAPRGGTSSSPGLGHRRVTDGMGTASPTPDAMPAAVQRAYDRLLDAGYGPGQVRVELTPEGEIQTLVSDDDLDRPAIAPGVLTAIELWRRDPRASDAIMDIQGLTEDAIDACLAAFLRRLHGQGRKLTEGLRWRYVWRVQSMAGRGRVLEIEVRDEWWPPLFDPQDRACHRAAFDEIKQRELITDAPDFDYRVEAGTCITKEELR